MASGTRQRRPREIEYATTDGKPMAETELHRDDMVDTIQTLQDFFAGRPSVYVSGNLLLYYEECNRRKHVAPDVLVTIGIDKGPRRDYYLVWKEGKAPDFVAEITSKTTKREDLTTKLAIYRDILRVPEYVLFDPTGGLPRSPAPGVTGWSRGEVCVPSSRLAGRLPSETLGLHLERDGERLRLFDPATRTYLLTRIEQREVAERRAEEEGRRGEEPRPPADGGSPRRTSASAGRSRPFAADDAPWREDLAPISRDRR